MNVSERTTRYGMTALIAVAVSLVTMLGTAFGTGFLFADLAKEKVIEWSADGVDSAITAAFADYKGDGISPAVAAYVDQRLATTVTDFARVIEQADQIRALMRELCRAPPNAALLRRSLSDYQEDYAARTGQPYPSMDCTVIPNGT